MIIALSGPSGIGKGYIKERLLKSYPYVKELAWLTTRPLRSNEANGNRISIKSEEFDKMANNGELTLIQSLHGHRYGIRVSDLLPGKESRLTEIHPENLVAALNINPQIIAIGLTTKDLSLLQERLSKVRKTESETEVAIRMTRASEEIESILINHKLYAAVIEVSRDNESSIYEKVDLCLSSYLR